MKFSDLPELEQQTLQTFFPYDDGITLDTDTGRLKASVMASAHALAERGLMIVKEGECGQAFFTLTPQGWKIVGTTESQE